MQRSLRSEGASHLIIFSDVDGTLLDQRGRQPAAWQDIRASLGIATIVLTSSRTVEELRAVQRLLGIDGPLIAENGAIIALTGDWIDRAASGTVVSLGGDPMRLIHLGVPASSFRAQVEATAMATGVRIETHREVFEAGMHDSGEEHRTVARLALARSHSLLLRVHAPEAARARFLSELASLRLTVASSGRWYVVQANSNKGMAVRTLLDKARRFLPDPLRVVGVGDRENDVSLLSAAAIRFVMRQDDGTVDPVLASTAHATVLTTPGVDAWREIAEHLLGHTEHMEIAS